MKNVCLQKWDNGRPGSGYGEVHTVPDDFRPEDVTGDYDELEIIESGRVVYRKVKGTVVYDERGKGDRDMSTRTFNDLVDEAKEQLDNGTIYGYRGTINAKGKCDKMARGLQAKVDEITATYLEDVPESFENMDILYCYIQELRDVAAEMKADVDTLREWGRSYGLTEYAKAILHDADDALQDLVFERSACERAYDIVHELIKNEEKAELERDREIETAQAKDEDELLIAMYRLVRDHGYDRLLFLVGIVADYTGNSTD